MTDDTDFKTLLTSVKIQLKTLISQSNLLGSSAKNVHFSENIFITHIPLIFKNLMLPIGYKFASERKKTITLSNVGKIDFPDEAKPYIEHIEVMLYPTAKSPINCAICSYEDKLVVSFTKSITDVSVVREFFKVLNNITKSEIYVYSNDWGDANEKM